MLADDARWQEFYLLRQQVEADRERHDQEMRAVIAEHAEALAEWETAKSEAMATGAVAPPAPTEPDLSRFDQLGAGFTARLEQISTRRDRYLVDQAERFEAEAAEEMRAILQAASDLVNDLRKTAARASEILVDVGRVRRAVDQRDPNSRPVAGHGIADRSRKRLHVVDLVWIVERGGDPLAVAPPPVRPETEPHDATERFPDQPVRGLIGPSPFGDPDVPDPDLKDATSRTTAQQGAAFRRRR